MPQNQEMDFIHVAQGGIKVEIQKSKQDSQKIQFPKIITGWAARAYYCMSVGSIPAAGFVTGTNGNFLRTLEAEGRGWAHTHPPQRQLHLKGV